MILTKKVETKITNGNNKHYTKLGYKVKNKDILLINVDELPKGSHALIDVKCDVCYKESKKPYRQYLNSFEKYGYYTCSAGCAKAKNKLTCLKKYGVDSFSKTDEYKEKFKNSCLKRFGSNSPLESEEVKAKIKATLIEKYGVDHNTKSKEVIENRKENTKKKYGVEHTTQLKSVKDKIKDVVFKKYDVNCVTQLKSVKNKIIKTNLKKYDVENPMQHEEFFIKQQKSAKQIKHHKKTGLNYRGTYELDFLNFCFKYNIRVEKGKRFDYIFENKKHYYFSDFFLPDYNLVIEIKSDYYYNKELLKNIEKKKSVNDHSFLFIINKEYKELNELINK